MIHWSTPLEIIHGLYCVNLISRQYKPPLISPIPSSSRILTPSTHMRTSTFPLHVQAADNTPPLCVPVLTPPLLRTAPGLESVYLAKALARAFLQANFWLPTNESTATAIARSISALEQNSERRILAKASAVRRIASRWRTYIKDHKHS